MFVRLSPFGRFVVGLASDDHDPDDSGEFMSACDDAFGFAEPAFVPTGRRFFFDH